MPSYCYLAVCPNPWEFQSLRVHADEYRTGGDAHERVPGEAETYFVKIGHQTALNGAVEECRRHNPSFWWCNIVVEDFDRTRGFAVPEDETCAKWLELNVIESLPWRTNREMTMKPAPHGDGWYYWWNKLEYLKALMEDMGGRGAMPGRDVEGNKVVFKNEEAAFKALAGRFCSD